MKIYANFSFYGKLLNLFFLPTFPFSRTLKNVLSTVSFPYSADNWILHARALLNQDLVSTSPLVETILERFRSFSHSDAPAHFGKSLPLVILAPFFPKKLDHSGVWSDFPIDFILY